jgi:hypothetical protein
MATVYPFGGPFKPYTVAYLCVCPARLAVVKDLRRREVFEVLVVGDDVDRGGGAVQVVVPDAEGF